MSDRISLQSKLEILLGNSNVYFNPPASLLMKYDCIRYKLSDIDSLKADDVKYRMYKAYELTYIHKDPDSPITDEIAALPMCSYDRGYVSDNLYHDVYTLYD